MTPACRGIRRLTRVTVAAVAVTAAAGCGAVRPAGEAARTPAQLLADAKTALAAASTVHIKGPLAGSGGTATLLDMRYEGTRGASGTLTQQGSTIRMIRVGTKVYVQGAQALFGAAYAQQVGNRWAVLSSTGVGAELAQVTNLKTIAGQILAPGTLQPTVGQVTLSGRKALTITDGSGGTTIWVSATGSPVPLQEKTAASTTQAVTFGNYGSPFHVTAPASPVTVPGLS